MTAPLGGSELLKNANGRPRTLAPRGMEHTRRPSSPDTSNPQGLNAEWKVRAGFALAVVCLLSIGVISYLDVSRLDQVEESSRYTAETISTLRLVLSHVTDAETAQRGYAMVGDETYLAPYYEARRDIEGDLDALYKSVSRYPEQQRRAEVLGPLVRERMARLAYVVELRRNKGFAAAQDFRPTTPPSTVSWG